jgi:hypothetical protein
MLNAGGPKPDFERFAGMVTAAVSSSIENNMIHPMSRAELAASAARVLRNGTALPLTRQPSGVDYLAQLDGLAAGGSPRGILTSTLCGVSQFTRLLSESYNGSAKCYHEAFLGWPLDHELGRFLVAKLSEIVALKRMGVAVGLNFIKDSQVPALAGKKLADLANVPISYFVKPDRHVLRLMLATTHRHQLNHDLISLPEVNAKDFYAQNAPQNSWPRGRTHELRRNGEKGQWDCVDDVLHWAQEARTVPLEIDRLLYLIGSGSYVDGQTLEVSQATRYECYFSKLFAGA